MVSRAGGKVPVEQGEHAHVLGPARGFLGVNDVGEVGHHHLGIANANAAGVSRELGVAAGEAREVEGDVKLAAGAGQIPDLGRRERDRVVAERQPVRLGLGPDPRAQVEESAGEPGQVFLAGVGVMSKSRVAGIGACCAMAAKAPMTT